MNQLDPSAQTDNLSPRPDPEPDSQPDPQPGTHGTGHNLALGLALLIFLVLAGYQLGLPGLHYDEAKEAGINAVELLSGAPVSAFRDGTLAVGTLRLPLMVQDYIGALNVFLALPFLGLTGVGVPNLRFLPIVLGLLTLIFLERTVAEWERMANGKWRMAPRSLLSAPRSPLFAVLLLAASPSFVFWSRQGIFVTNLTQPLSLLCVWMGVHWLRTGRQGALTVSALAAGLALYAKLLAVWIVGPFGLLAAGWWLWQRFGPGIQSRQDLPRPSLGGWAGAAGAFLIGLTPLILFNIQTGGTLESIGGNLGSSYYGVNNADVLVNLPVRLGQLIDTLQGDHLWYLGGIFANQLAPWVAAVGILAGLIRRPWVMLPPLLLVGLAVGASLFTVSDLFITHYALIQPFIVAVVALGLGEAGGGEKGGEEKGGAKSRFAIRHSPFATLLVAVWLFFDLSASVNYHRALTRSGGLADHSDATYHLAYHLRYNGLGAPIVLDWGMDAPVRFLTEGTVRPIEIFGYDSLAEPDPNFAQRLDQFLPNPANVYLLRTPESTVFQGRREAFLAQAGQMGLSPRLEATFTQRDGTVLFEIWRAGP